MVKINAPVSKRYAVLVLIIATLLGCFGIALIAVGQTWDAGRAGVDTLFIVDIAYQTANGTWVEKRDYSVKNPTLMWHGFLVIVPIIPAITLYFMKYRLVVVAYIVALTTALAGGITATLEAGGAWENILTIRAAYKYGKCSGYGASCTCQFVSNDATIDKRIAKLQEPCSEISSIHVLINVFFGLGVVSSILTTIALSIGFMVWCKPKLKPKEPKKFPAAYRTKRHHYFGRAKRYGSDYPLISTQGTPRPPTYTSPSVPRPSSPLAAEDPVMADTTKLVT